MMISRMAAALILIAATLPVPAFGQDAVAPVAPATLAELLERIRAGNAVEQVENERREAAFRQSKEQQRRLLEEALALKAAEEQRIQALEARFDENEKKIPELEETLRNRLGTLGELFGVVRQVAGDTGAQVASSIISAQLPGRGAAVSQLAQRREMPAIEDLEQLWFVLQQEMTESGRVVRFSAPVIAIEGGESQKKVIRIGAFNAVADGRYLQYVQESGKLTELGRQPAGSHLATVRALEGAREGIAGVSIDPSRGSLLSLLIETPDAEERIGQGGLVGYTIIALGAIGLLIAADRLVSLFVVGRRIRAQVREPKARLDNPLGRILAVSERYHTADVETLELKLDEAILKETPALERGIAMIKVLAVVAPLLGLLGTVTGMIKTFQVITLFGAGDPKLMAGGIAEALVTTMLGLIMAVPLTLLHVLVSGQSRRLIQVLDEQSAGIVAERAEGLDADAAEGRKRALAG
jgi:biopolymer transport protein ExbB